MASRMRQAVAPLYLLACLILGGSSQGIWANMLLQLIGLAILAWALAARSDEPLSLPARQLFWIIGLGLAVAALQLIPLPGSLWPQLGGREEIAAGYRILGLATPAAPLSLAPDDSIAALLALIPPLGLLCAIVRVKAYRRTWLALALLAGTVAGILLGALQVASPEPRTSPWYLYPRVSFGFATGFFANANHMAMLLVIALPFLAALVAAARRASVQRYSAVVALAAGVALVILVGIVLNRSIAGYGLAIPVLAASALILLPARARTRRWAAIATAVLGAGALAAIVLSPIGEKSLGTQRSLSTRAEIGATTVEAAGDFLPFGSGVGTFEGVYHLYERPDLLDPTVINHAHNDYLELALETGVPGILVLALFLAWWAAAAARAWRVEGGTYARAASIASAVLLVHSAVEFPLRTAALSASFAMCLALMIERRVRRERSDSELWPTRHVVLE